MPVNHLLPFLLLSGLSSPCQGKDRPFGFGEFDFYERIIGCLPRQQQQMAWRLKKLGYITRECYALHSPPPCEDAPDSWDASIGQIISCMSECVGPSMQLLSLLKTFQGFQGFQGKPEDCIEVAAEDVKHT